MIVSLIAALAKNHVIGVDGQLPWRQSNDLKRFKRLTLGHHILMGRKTYDSIGKLLPGRQAIILTRQHGLTIPGALISQNLEEAMQLAKIGGDEHLYVAGGGEIYAQTLPIADRLYLTYLDVELEGDTFFPEFNADQWELVEQEDRPADKKNHYPYSFCTYHRKQN
ncbi:MAG: dihydrofolate reductase [Pirellulaceae bacterium]|nr:dihydrofolate reductase [Pirellulaceae bacterium]